MKHGIFFLFFFLFSYSAAEIDTAILLRFIKPSGANAHDIPLHADNITMLKTMSGTIHDLLESMMQTNEPMIIPIALTEHADDYFYKLLLPLTKRLYENKKKNKKNMPCFMYNPY